MLSENKTALYFLWIAFVFAFIVILLGAMTRLKDAGLGCPDWPGCYGQLMPPSQSQPINSSFSGETINPSKAWFEMIHRYAAASLALLSFAAAILILHQRKLPGQPIVIPGTLLFLLLLQGLLGKWTVTLRLHPFVVMSHLLMGLGLLSLLWILIWRLNSGFLNPCTRQEKTLRYWAAFALPLLILQIGLGGWTSSNYAAFVCPDFPLCQGQWWPRMNFSEGFHLWLNNHKNFEGGLLSNTARTAIQMSHRIMALITSSYFCFLIYKIFQVTMKSSFRAIALLLSLFLVLQISLGILNILWVLPLPIAMAHNAVAALLLLTIITLNLQLADH